MRHGAGGAPAQKWAHTFGSPFRSTNLHESSTTAAIAVANDAWDHVLVGFGDGKVYRSIVGSQGLKYQELLNHKQPVSSLYFSTDHQAYVGFETGEVIRYDHLYETGAVPVMNGPFGPRKQAVVQFAPGESANEIFAAFGGPAKNGGGVYVSEDSGDTWKPSTAGRHR